MFPTWIQSWSFAWDHSCHAFLMYDYSSKSYRQCYFSCCCEVARFVMLVDFLDKILNCTPARDESLTLSYDTA